MRQSTPIVAREGITLSFSEPLACVGASVTPSIGSTNSGRSGSFARQRLERGRAVGRVEAEVAQQRERPLGHVEVGLTRRPSPAAAARASAARCRRCAALLAWPACAVRRQLEAVHALLGDADAVQAPAVVRDVRAGTLVQEEVAAHEARGGSRSARSRPRPRRSPRRRPRRSAGRRAPGASPSRASETPAATSAAVCDFMSSAPRPHSSPSITSPHHGSCCHSPGMREHRVDVGEQAQRRAVGLAAQAGDEIRALLEPPDEGHLEAGVAQGRGQLLLRRPLIARRVDGVVPDEPREQRGRLRLQVGHAPMLPAGPVTRSRAG